MAPDAGARVIRHLALAAEELGRAFAVALQAFGEETRGAALLRAALRDEERRWRERAPRDAAAARVAEVFAALADLLEPPKRREPRGKFDPPEVRWDTPARWRS